MMQALSALTATIQSRNALAFTLQPRFRTIAARGLIAVPTG